MRGAAPNAAALREAIYRRAPERTELAGLLAMAPPADVDYFALVADVARDALVSQGAIGTLDADWLMEVCGDGLGLPTRAAFEALKSVLRHVTPPRDLIAFAVRVVERAILTGERAALGEAEGEAGRVLESDVAALREICAAARPDRALAEALFDIAHATATADNDPGFDAFFAEILRAYLIGETPAGMSFEACLAAVPAEHETPAVDGLADGGYGEVARSAEARFETVARAPAGGARWALAYLSRGDLTRAERRLVAALRDPSALPLGRAA